jgi:hypothetical protein
MTGTCVHCGETFERKNRGRPRKWCKGACAVAAYRERRQLLAPFITAGIVEQNGHGPTVRDPEVALAFDTRQGNPLPGYLLVFLKNGVDLDGDPLDGAAFRIPSGPTRGARRELVAA